MPDRYQCASLELPSLRFHGLDYLSKRIETFKEGNANN